MHRNKFDACIDGKVYVWLNALQNSGSRCDKDVGAKIVKEHLPQSEVDRCHTFVRAIKLVLQGLDEPLQQDLIRFAYCKDSLHELHHLLEGSKKDALDLNLVSSKSICHSAPFGFTSGCTALDMDGSPLGQSPQDEETLTQRAAEEAVRLGVKALRMTLQKIGGTWGLLAAGSALAAKDWRVEARRRNAKGLESFAMDDFMPKSNTKNLRHRLRSQTTTF
eukprot:Skav202024  [mRNA]  locus=scaffold1138:147060:149899:+ [translate_table: standard]